MIKGGLVIAGVVLMCSSGCLPFVPAKTGEPIREELVGTVMPGKTTKQEMLEQFGPPTAIVRHHEIAAVLVPRSLKAGPSTSFKLMTGDYRFQTDTFFEMFSPERDPEYHRIYYYDYIVSSMTGHCFLFAFYDTGGTRTDRLWVLVNEKTGTVEDYVFKKYNQKALFGRAH